MEKAKVKVIFPAVERGRPTWPYINYDVKSRAKEVMGILKKQIPEIKFSHQVIYTREREKEETKSAKVCFLRSKNSQNHKSPQRCEGI